jgi:hypothetical protein
MTEDGQITLKDLVETKANDMDVLPGTVKANGDSQKLTFGGKSDLVMDNDTVLNMVTAKDVETFEGYKNIKIDEQDVDALVIYSGRTVKEIFVVDGSLYNKNNYVYYTGTEIAERAGKYYITLFVDGEKTTYKYATNVEPQVGIYKLEVEDNTATLTAYGYESVHKAEVTEETELDFDIKQYGAAKNTLTYADGVKIYDLTDVEDGVAAQLNAVAEGDEIMYVENAEGKGVVVTHIWVLKHYGKTVENDKNVESADVNFTKNENTWRFDFANLKKDDVVVITAYNYAEGIDGVYATYSFTQAADGTNGFQQTYNVDAQMSFVVTINGTLVYDGCSDARESPFSL